MSLNAVNPFEEGHNFTMDSDIQAQTSYSSSNSKLFIHSQDDDESDFDDSFETAIKSRSSENLSNKLGLNEEIIDDIDTFFDIPSCVGIKYSSPSTIAESISSESLKTENHTDDELSTNFNPNYDSFDSLCNSSSSNYSSTLSPYSLNRTFHHAIIPNYYNNSSTLDFMASFSDEILIRIFSYADYTTQKINTRYSLIQIKVSRLRIVDALAKVIEVLANEIESELFLVCDQRLSKSYRDRARSLVSNMKSNKDLKTRVLEGLIEPFLLVRMTTAELAREDLTLQREGE